MLGMGNNAPQTGSLEYCFDIWMVTIPRSLGAGNNVDGEEKSFLFFLLGDW